MDLHRVLDSLNGIAKYNLADFFHGRDINVEQLLHDMTSILGCLKSGSLSFEDSKCLVFLKTSLPRLVEVSLRRKTAKEHADLLSRMLNSLMRMIADPCGQQMIELCELRNFIFAGSSPFLFITLQDLQFSNVNQGTPYYCLGNSFFSDHGKPCVAYKSSKCVYFWADEWEKELGGENAIGHFVSIYCGNGVWREGQVVDYHVPSSSHVIKFDSKDSIQNEAMNTSNRTKVGSNYAAHIDVSVAPSDIERVHLKTILHEWTDTSHRDRLPPDLRVIVSELRDVPVRLNHSTADRGRFVRIWWSRYQRHFYGRIVDFDVRTREHSVTYEDGDNRTYDMNSKEYEVVIPPDTLSIQNCHSDAEASAVVCAWHQKHLLASVSSKEHNLGPTDDSQLLVAVRPSAAAGYAMSTYLLDLINEYYTAGGFKTMFKLLSSPEIPPPSTYNIVLYLRLIYSIKQKIKSSFFRSLIWEVKEAVPLALMRYDDRQFKNITRVDLQDINHMMKDLIQTVGDDSATSDIAEAIEMLNLHLAAKMLNCSQLQKRYLGLSIIKEAIESCYPRVHAFLVQKSVRNTTTNNNNATVQRLRQSSISAADLSLWLVESKIVESIFGTSLHQDLAARSDVILVFMSIMR